MHILECRPSSELGREPHANSFVFWFEGTDGHMACIELTCLKVSVLHKEYQNLAPGKTQSCSEYVRKNIIVPKLLRVPGEGLQSMDSIANYSIMKGGQRRRQQGFAYLVS